MCRGQRQMFIRNRIGPDQLERISLCLFVRSDPSRELGADSECTPGAAPSPLYGQKHLGRTECPRRSCLRNAYREAPLSKGDQGSARHRILDHYNIGVPHYATIHKFLYDTLAIEKKSIMRYNLSHVFILRL